MGQHAIETIAIAVYLPGHDSRQRPGAVILRELSKNADQAQHSLHRGLVEHGLVLIQQGQTS
jgi:hypothetical protein